VELVLPAPQEHQELLEPLEIQDRRVRKVNRDLLVWQEILEQLVLVVARELREQMARLVPRECLGSLAHKEQPGRQDHLVRLEILEVLVFRELKEFQGLLVVKATQERLERLALPEDQVLVVPQVPMGYQEILDLRVTLELLVPKDLPVNKEALDLLGLQDL